MDMTKVKTDITEDETRRARQYGDLVWADGNLFVYRYRDFLYVMEPPEHITCEVLEALEGHPAYAPQDPPEDMSDIAAEVDRAIIEALLREPSQLVIEEAPINFEYDPAEVLHFVHEIAYALRECSSLLSNQLINRPFTRAEHEAVKEAGELLQSYATEYGVDFDEDDGRNLKLSA